MWYGMAMISTRIGRIEVLWADIDEIMILWRMRR